ncbi:PilZ domain-containing protein [Pseudomarimonas arenosa]|uniref:PilZ domain-containing protein n=1 Tax=Pseudomarimonas arenosa TaxID=2774145 RepID=A0AAW3ZQX5_9GAMM|nr:PilZ domain-containing protein [Pseudomarimonas arenosa]MBD8527884.1 PilZ domain-containing protein [Pseudomarimonas arenosa]
MTEYRRSKRRQVPQVVEVVDTMTEQVVGRIGNISETGMLLVTGHPGCDDGLYQLQFQLPGPQGVTWTVAVGAHQLWCDLTRPPSIYWTGFRFIDLGPEDGDRLRQWIAQPGGKFV